MKLVLTMSMPAVSVNSIATSGNRIKIPGFTQGKEIPGSEKRDLDLTITGTRSRVYCDKLVASDARQVAITRSEKGHPQA